jgi:hypothetical protein
MSSTADTVQRTEWRELLERLTKEHQGASVAIEVIDRDSGDGYEAEKIPLAFVEYDPKDDVFILGVGGTSSRYPVVLRHLVEHPKSITADKVGSGISVAIEVIGEDDTRT